MFFAIFFSLVHPVLAEEYLPAVFALVRAPVRPAGGNGHGHHRGFVLFLLSGGGGCGLGKLSLEFLKGFAAVLVLKVLLDLKNISCYLLNMRKFVFLTATDASSCLTASLQSEHFQNASLNGTNSQNQQDIEE